MFSVSAQNILPKNDISEVLNDQISHYSESTPSKHVLLELKHFRVEPDFETGNIKGTNMHFGTCLANIISGTNKGDIAFFSGQLKTNCPENSQCSKCVEAFNVAIGNNDVKQYPELYEDLSYHAYENTIIG
ncbi:MAG: hypothetical protein ACR5KV_01885 [Wolbachia sp.]